MNRLAKLTFVLVLSALLVQFSAVNASHAGKSSSTTLSISLCKAWGGIFKHGKNSVCTVGSYSYVQDIDSLIVPSKTILIFDVGRDFSVYGTLTNNGQVIVNPGATFRNDGTIANNGLITSSGDFVNTNRIDNFSVFNNLANFSISGTFYNDKTDIHNGIFENSGTTTVNADGYFQNSAATITNRVGGVITNNGRIENYSNSYRDGTVDNFGNVNNNADFTNSAVITNTGVITNQGIFTSVSPGVIHNTTATNGTGTDGVLTGYFGGLID